MSNNSNSRSVARPTETQVEKIIDLQISRVQNEAKELELKEKEMDHNAKLAHKSIELQAKIEESRPAENRKTITRLGYIVGGLMVVCMLFMIACLYLNKEEFLYSFVKGVGYIITTGIGYFAGKKSSKPHDSKTHKYDDAEMIE